MLAAIHANDLQRLFAEDDIDTFVFRDSLTQVQAVRYTPQRKG
jgi:hypothetical protein